jgi:hypothetical protein
MQRDRAERDDCIIPVIAGVRRAWHDTAPYLTDCVIASASSAVAAMLYFREELEGLSH